MNFLVFKTLISGVIISEDEVYWPIESYCRDKGNESLYLQINHPLHNNSSSLVDSYIGSYSSLISCPELIAICCYLRPYQNSIQKTKHEDNMSRPLGGLSYQRNGNFSDMTCNER